MNDLRTYLSRELGDLDRNLSEDQIVWLATQVLLRGVGFVGLKEAVRKGQIGENYLVIVTVPPEVNAVEFAERTIAEHGGAKAGFLFQLSGEKAKDEIRKLGGKHKV